MNKNNFIANKGSFKFIMFCKQILIAANILYSFGYEGHPNTLDVKLTSDEKYHQI